MKPVEEVEYEETYTLSFQDCSRFADEGQEEIASG